MNTINAQIKNALEMELISTEDVSPDTPTSCYSTNTRPTTDKEELFSLGKEETQSSCSDSSSSPPRSSKEVIDYLKMNLVGENDDPLVGWKTVAMTLPLLQNLVVKYLSIPTTSASAERCFSSAGITASKLRCRITGRHVEQLNLLHCNKNALT